MFGPDSFVKEPPRPTRCGGLGEYGLIVLQRIDQLRRALPLLCEDVENGLSAGFRELLDGLRQDLVPLDGRIEAMDDKLAQAARTDEAARRLQSIPGIGPITATALVASLGDAGAFRKSREVPAWIGLAPRQHSGGGKDRLSDIGKRGNTYWRTRLIQGARAALKLAKNQTDPRNRWVTGVGERRHQNIAALALANENARIVWALLSQGACSDSEYGTRVGGNAGQEAPDARTLEEGLAA